MKANEYIKKLQNLIIEHGNLEIIYSSDDEGNDFRKMNYSPSAGHYDGAESFIYIQETIGNKKQYGDLEINSICIN